MAAVCSEAERIRRLFGEAHIKGMEKARERRDTAVRSVENGKIGCANTKRTRP